MAEQSELRPAEAAADTEAEGPSDLELSTSNEEPTSTKCSKSSCPFRSHQGVAKYPCWVQECEKELHFECYNNFVLKKRDPNPKVRLEHFLPVGHEIAVACTKKHYEIAAKQASLQAGGGDNVRNVAWDKDGMNGESDPVNSQSVLIDWLRNPSN